MSRQPTDTPGDWRRQRRPASGSQREPSPPGGTSETPAAPEAEEALSRTAFSFLEPALNLIGSFGGPLVIAGVAGLVSGIAVVAFVGSMRVYGYVNIGVGAGLLVLVGLISLSSVLAAFLGRTGRYGVNALVMVSAFTGIIVVVNFVSFENHNRMDVTATNEFSLATRTKQLLKDLDQPVLATAFYITDFRQGVDMIGRRAKVENTLREFSARSGNFTYRFMDPDLEREVAVNYGVTQYESVVVEATDSGLVSIVKKPLSDPDYSRLEQDLVTSLLEATGQERKAVYFLEGHGERNVDSSLEDADGYSLVKDGLEQDNYDVRTILWRPSAEDVSVPDDPAEECQDCPPGAALLVVARPTADLPEAQARVLDLYLKGQNADGTPRREAGRLIVLLDPDTPESWRSFLSRWGVVVSPGYIRDVGQALPQQPRIFKASPYLPPPPQLAEVLPPSIAEITMPRGVELGSTLMGGAAPLFPISDGLRNIALLAISSGDSYLIGDVQRTDPITDGDQADRRGPFFTAMYVQAVAQVGGKAPTSAPAGNEVASLVAFGDSDFLANGFLTRPGGSPDLFLNSANYLLGDYSLVSIRPKAFAFREFKLDLNELNFVRYSSLLFVPGLLALMAGLVWWVRR